MMLLLFFLSLLHRFLLRNLGFLLLLLVHLILLENRQL